MRHKKKIWSWGRMWGFWFACVCEWMNYTFFQTPNEYFHKNANTWLQIEVDFSELCRNVNKRIIRSRRLCGTDASSVSRNNNNNINKNGWQAHYLCVSAPSSVWQTRCKLKCTFCPADILKICQKQLRQSFSSFFEELWEFSSSVFLLQINVRAGVKCCDLKI